MDLLDLSRLDDWHGNVLGDDAPDLVSRGAALLAARSAGIDVGGAG